MGTQATLSDTADGKVGDRVIEAIDGEAPQARNRNMNALNETRQSATFPAGSNITSLTFIASRKAATAYTTLKKPYAIVTIDPADDTEADANLGTSGAPPAALTSDSEVYKIPIGESITVPLSSPIAVLVAGRVDARNVDNTAADQIDLWIGAN